MTVCSAIKPNGERCRGIAKAGSEWCPAHDPARAAARSRGASKAAKSKPSTEIRGIKQEIRDVIAAVRTGGLERGTGAVVFQGYNVLIKAAEQERKIRELDEVEERVAALERRAAS